MPAFHFEFAKTITVSVEADSLTQAKEMAYAEAQKNETNAWSKADAEYVATLWESVAMLTAYSNT